MASSRLLADSPERAILKMWDARLKTWTLKDVSLLIEPHAFFSGQYDVFKAKLSVRGDKPKEEGEGITSKESSTVVIKFAADATLPTKVHSINAEVQAYASLWTDYFNKHDPQPPCQISFSRTFALELLDRKGKPCATGENFVNGEFAKFNDMMGGPIAMPDDDRKQLQGEIANAFSHFTFEKSHQQLVICNIQGVGTMYTDPCIHSKTFGNCIGQAGVETSKVGLKAFAAKHICNDVCKAMALDVNLSELIENATAPAVEADANSPTKHLPLPPNEEGASLEGRQNKSVVSEGPDVQPAEGENALEETDLSVAPKTLHNQQQEPRTEEQSSGGNTISKLELEATVTAGAEEEASESTSELENEDAGQEEKKNEAETESQVEEKMEAKTEENVKFAEEDKESGGGKDRQSNENSSGDDESGESGSASIDDLMGSSLSPLSPNSTPSTPKIDNLAKTKRIGNLGKTLGIPGIRTNKATERILAKQEAKKKEEQKLQRKKDKEDKAKDIRKKKYQELIRFADHQSTEAKIKKNLAVLNESEAEKMKQARKRKAEMVKRADKKKLLVETQGSDKVDNRAEKRILALIAMKNSLQKSGISDFGPYFDQEELQELMLDFYS